MFEEFILINGEIKSLNQPPPMSDIWINDKIGVGAGIWFCSGSIPLFYENIQLLKEESEILFDSAPALFSDPAELKRLLLRLINKNKAFKSGLIHIHIKPGYDLSEFTVTIQKSGENHFFIKAQSLLLAYSDEIKFSGNKYNPYRFYNRPFWAMVEQAAKHSKKDGFILLNEKKEMVEIAEGNLYFIKGDVLFTPAPETGCYLPPIRNKVLEAGSRLGIKVVETTRLNDSVIQDMDEAFIAGEILAMQKIMGIGLKRFTHQKTANINEEINRILLSE